MRDLDTVFDKLKSSPFRQRFKLGRAERTYLSTKGLAVVIDHARDFIRTRLAPAAPRNDGKQTPWRGHPVFIAQHATATCCRGCLAKWHGIPAGRELTPTEQEHVVAAIQRWLVVEAGERAHVRRPVGRATSIEPNMSARDVVALYDLLEHEGIHIWIDGGWAVDALLGEQTRRHADLDIALETRFLERLRIVLTKRGYQDVPRDDTRPWNFVLGDGSGREVDIHAFTLDENGDGVYGPPQNGEYYRADALTGRGVIDGRHVRCISPEWLVRFHSGYTLKPKDFHDVTLLCERFEIELPPEYRVGHSPQVE